MTGVQVLQVRQRDGTIQPFIWVGARVQLLAPIPPQPKDEANRGAGAQ